MEFTTGDGVRSSATAVLPCRRHQRGALGDERRVLQPSLFPGEHATMLEDDPSFCYDDGGLFFPCSRRHRLPSNKVAASFLRFGRCEVAEGSNDTPSPVRSEQDATPTSYHRRRGDTTTAPALAVVVSPMGAHYDVGNKIADVVAPATGGYDDGYGISRRRIPIRSTLRRRQQGSRRRSAGDGVKRRRLNISRRRRAGDEGETTTAKA
nr:hypothetical protein Iba_chr01cCG4500 [Ipomoea batatas]